MGKNNIGNLSALSSPFPGVIKRMITAPKSFSISLATAATKAGWQNAILNTPALRIYLWPNFRTFNNASEKFVYEKTDLSVMPVRDGIPEFDMEFLESIYIHKAMRSHTGTSPASVFFIDNKNRIWGQSLDSVNLIGFDMALLNTETIMWSDGKTASKSPVKIVMVDSSQWDDNAMFVEGKSFVNALLPLTTVTIVQTANLAATIIKCTVQAADGTSIDGLAYTDFKLTSVAGVNHAITAASQDQFGTYSLTSATAAATDLLTLVSAATLSIPGYEAPASIAIA